MKNPQETHKRPRLFDRLQAGLTEGIAHARGETELVETTLTIPAPPPEYDAARVRALRSHLNLSQPHFSRILNVSAKTVQSWEQGTRKPGQSSARLLQIIENPDTLALLRSSASAARPPSPRKSRSLS